MALHSATDQVLLRSRPLLVFGYCRRPRSTTSKTDPGSIPVGYHETQYPPCHRNHDRAPESGPEKSRRSQTEVEDTGAGKPDNQLKHQGVDDEQEKAESEDNERNAEESDDRLGYGVGQPHDGGDDQELPPLPVEFQTTHQPNGNPEGCCSGQKCDNESHATDTNDRETQVRRLHVSRLTPRLDYRSQIRFRGFNFIEIRKFHVARRLTTAFETGMLTWDRGTRVKHQADMGFGPRVETRHIPLVHKGRAFPLDRL